MDDELEPPPGGLLEGWMTQPELAAELGVSAVTVRRWGLPFIRIGNKTLYRREAVRKWLLAQERKPEDEGNGEA